MEKFYSIQIPGSIKQEIDDKARVLGFKKYELVEKAVRFYVDYFLPKVTHNSNQCKKRRVVSR